MVVNEAKYQIEHRLRFMQPFLTLEDKKQNKHTTSPTHRCSRAAPPLENRIKPVWATSDRQAAPLLSSDIIPLENTLPP